MSFTLPGFRSFVRIGILLTSGFTATVNGELAVGSLEETITVTGEAPIVDTQNVAAREVFTRDTIESLPIAKTTGGWSTLIPAMRLPPNTSEAATGGLDVGATQSVAGDRMERVFDGVDVNLSGRFDNGATLNGGIAFGNTVIDNCGIAVDSPQALRFCRTEFTWTDDVQFKINGSHPLPWNLRASFVFQSVPGFPISADYVVTSALAAPSLGRNFSAGARGTSTVALVEPFTLFEDRSNLLDLRFSRRFAVGRTTITGHVDLSNVLNANTPQQVNPQYGPPWLKVTNALSARVMRLGVQLGF